jgi:hypothetical protein
MDSSIDKSVGIVFYIEVGVVLQLFNAEPFQPQPLLRLDGANPARGQRSTVLLHLQPKKLALGHFVNVAFCLKLLKKILYIHFMPMEEHILDTNARKQLS